MHELLDVNSKHKQLAQLDVCLLWKRREFREFAAQRESTTNGFLIIICMDCARQIAVKTIHISLFTVHIYQYQHTLWSRV